MSSEVARLKSFYLSQITVMDEALSLTEDRGIHSLLRKKKVLVFQVLYQLKTTLSQLFPETDFSECVNYQSYEVSTDGTCIYPESTFTVTESDDIDDSASDDDGDDAYKDDFSSEGETDDL